MTVIRKIAPYVGQPEALAEAVLYEALLHPLHRQRFQALARLHGNAELVNVQRQEWSSDGSARHDLVLVSKTERKYCVELKGTGGFTPRQRRALKKGPEASDRTRIDVLVHPQWLTLPKGIHSGVRLVTWRQIDQVVFKGRHPLGRLADLWLSSAVLEWKEVRRDARSYISYRNGDAEDSATWRTLWASMDYLKRSLSDTYEFGKIDGCRKSEGCWYYGTTIASGKSHWWIGWLFHDGFRGRTKVALVVEEQESEHRCRYRRSRLPDWYCAESWGTLLSMPQQGKGRNLDLDGVLKLVRRTCR